MAATKLCIFCGSGLVDKSREHVLPEWLLELTGGKDRTALLGRDWSRSGFPPRKYAFSDFHFPACSGCNSRYSQMEEATKAIVQRMIQHQPLTAGEIETLMDWLDKVRIGLWLGIRMRERNVARIEPKFFIDQRLGMKDRVVFIQRLPDPETRLTLYGIDTPIFQIHPAVFAIRINGIMVTNGSCDWLIAYHFGLPCTTELGENCPDGRTSYKLNPGTKHFCGPPWLLVAGEGTWFGQPIIPINQLSDKSGLEYYNTDWAKSLGFNPDTGRCRVFSGKGNTPIACPLEASDLWLPGKADDCRHISGMTLVSQEGTYDWYGRLSGAVDYENKKLEQQRLLVRLERDDPVRFRVSVELGDL